MKQSQDQVDVAIIGAGVAGLSCAYRLKQAGINSVVLEREPIVGGRTKVVQIADEYVPTGAGVVYRGTPTDDLCTELGIERFPIAPKAFSVHYDGVTVVAHNHGQLAAGLPLSIEAKRNLLSVLERIRHDYSSYAGHGLSSSSNDIEGMSFASYIGDMHPEVARFFAAIVEPSCLVPPQQISAKYALRYLVSKLTSDPNHIAYIPRGMHEIAFALHREVSDRVELSAEVEKVERRDGTYVLDVRRGEEESQLGAQAVVFAVPGPVVENLTHTLPAWKIESIKKIGSVPQVVMSTVLEKSDHATWDGVFFTPVVGGEFEWVTDCRSGTGLSTNGRVTLQLGVVGPRAVAALARTNDDLIAEWTKGLERVFPGSADLMLGAHIQRWEHCFAIPRWDRAEHLPAVQRSLGGLHFAGDYASDSAGTHGAIASGARVAREIAEELTFPSTSGSAH